MAEERVVFLAAPVGMRESPEYLAAFRLAEGRHPDKRIVADSELWSTAKEFHRTYKQRLGSFAVSDLYILTAPDGTVGKGIFQMWRYLVKHQESKPTALFPTGGKDGSFEELEAYELSVIGNGKDTKRYAVPVESTALSPE